MWPHLTRGLAQIAAADLPALRKLAESAELGRARICLHASVADPIQEMVVALRPGTYIPPHRHGARSESLHMLEGRVLVAFFDEAGHTVQTLALGGRDEPLLYRLAQDRWHTVLCLGDGAIFHEVVGGPFDRTQARLAPWAPEAEDAGAVAAFLARLLEGVDHGR